MKMNRPMSGLRLGIVAGIAALALVAAPATMVIGPIPAAAAGADAEQPAQTGDVTDTISYEIYRSDQSGHGAKIVFKGTGSLPDYADAGRLDSDVLWRYFAGKFYGGISEVVIEDGITHVGDYTFYGLTALNKVTFPSKMDSIGAHAFEGCSGLSALDLPDSVERIEDYAFKGVGRPQNLMIPNDIVYIGEKALPQPINLLSFGNAYPQMSSSSVRTATSFDNDDASKLSRAVDLSHVKRQISGVEILQAFNGYIGAGTNTTLVTLGGNYEKGAVLITSGHVIDFGATDVDITFTEWGFVDSYSRDGYKVLDIRYENRIGDAGNHLYYQYPDSLNALGTTDSFSGMDSTIFYVRWDAQAPYQLGDYRGSKPSSQWTTPTAPEGQVFSGWYKDASLTNPYGSADTTGDAWARFTPIEALVWFRGGSLRLDGPEANVSTSMRFGYGVKLPDGCTINQGGKTGWGYRVGTDTKVFKLFPQILNTGTEDGVDGITVNIVFTGIPVRNYGTPIHTAFTLSFTTADGTVQTIDLGEETRDVYQVATFVRDNATAQGQIDYVNKILATKNS